MEKYMQRSMTPKFKPPFCFNPKIRKKKKHIIINLLLPINNEKTNMEKKNDVINK